MPINPDHLLFTKPITCRVPKGRWGRLMSVEESIDWIDGLQASIAKTLEPVKAALHRANDEPRSQVVADAARDELATALDALKLLWKKS